MFQLIISGLEKLSYENSLLLYQEIDMTFFKNQFLINVVFRFCLPYLGCKHHRQTPAKRKAFALELKKKKSLEPFSLIMNYFLAVVFLTSKMWAR